jgi:hypothetical protein
MTFYDVLLVDITRAYNNLRILTPVDPDFGTEYGRHGI